MPIIKNNNIIKRKASMYFSSCFILILVSSDCEIMKNERKILYYTGNDLERKVIPYNNNNKICMYICKKLQCKVVHNFMWHNIYYS